MKRQILIKSQKPQVKEVTKEKLNTKECLFDEIQIPNLLLDHKNFFITNPILNLEVVSARTKHKYQLQFQWEIGKSYREFLRLNQQKNLVLNKIDKIEEDIIAKRQQMMKLKSSMSHSYSIQNLRMSHQFSEQQNLDRKFSLMSENNGNSSNLMSSSQDKLMPTNKLSSSVNKSLNFNSPFSNKNKQSTGMSGYDRYGMNGLSIIHENPKQQQQLAKKNLKNMQSEKLQEPRILPLTSDNLKRFEELRKLKSMQPANTQSSLKINSKNYNTTQQDLIGNQNQGYQETDPGYFGQSYQIGLQNTRNYETNQQQINNPPTQNQGGRFFGIPKISMGALLSNLPMIGRTYSEYKPSTNRIGTTTAVKNQEASNTQNEPPQSSRLVKPKAPKTIASDKSVIGSIISGKQSVLSTNTGFMFKCFDSMYGAKRMLHNTNMRSNYNGSVRASVISRVDQDFDCPPIDQNFSPHDNNTQAKTQMEDEYKNMEQDQLELYKKYELKNSDMVLIGQEKKGNLQRSNQKGGQQQISMEEYLNSPIKD
eukprot:403374376